MRPRNRRCINHDFKYVFFKPNGVEALELERISLSLEEIEALRLKDLESLSQKKAAAELGVSQPTFHRTVCSARKKISKALIEGYALEIVK